MELNSYVGSCNVEKEILCFVDRASRYIRVMKTNSMHSLSSVYFISQLIHVSGMFVAHHQEAYCIYTAIGTCCSVPTRPTDSQLKSA